MKEIKKKVTIVPTMPIRTVVPTISTTVTKFMTTSDIRRCIIARASVYEILRNGQRVALTLSNYDKDNEPVYQPAPFERHAIIIGADSDTKVETDSSSKVVVEYNEPVAVKDTTVVEPEIVVDSVDEEVASVETESDDDSIGM